MDMKEEMMSDAVDDAMEGEDEGEGEEMEGDKILKEVFDEIGMSMNDSVSLRPKESLPRKDATSIMKLRVKADHVLAEREGYLHTIQQSMPADNQLASAPTANLQSNQPIANTRVAVAEGLTSSPAAPAAAGGNGGGPMSAEETDLQKRLDALRRD